MKFISLSNLIIWIFAVSLSVYYSKSPSRDKHILKAVEFIQESYNPNRIQIESLPSNWKLVAIIERYTEFYLSDKECNWILSKEERSNKDEILIEKFDKAKLFLYKKAPNYR